MSYHFAARSSSSSHVLSGVWDKHFYFFKVHNSNQYFIHIENNFGNLLSLSMEKT